jgi:hypothetical protein
VDAGANFAKLYINPCRENCSKMQVWYGRTDAADEYNVEISTPSGTGVFSYTINALAPNTKYFFKIKCINGCSSGSFGDVLSATTSSCVTSYYRVGAPQKGACGTGGSETQTSGSVQGASTTVAPTPTKVAGSVLGASTGGVLAAAGNSSLLWVSAVVGSGLIAFVATLKTSSYSSGFKSRRK